MAVNVLYDVAEDQAVLYCSTTDWAFGPVFYGPSADEQAMHFRDWFTSGEALKVAIAVDARPLGILGADGDDPRDYGDRELERLYSEWRNRFTDASGALIEEAEEVA